MGTNGLKPTEIRAVLAALQQSGATGVEARVAGLSATRGTAPAPTAGDDCCCINNEPRSYYGAKTACKFEF